MQSMFNRTHRCGELNESYVGSQVSLCAWVQKSRNLGSILFVWLRDRSGLVQVVFDQNVCDEATFAMANKLRSEFVVCVEGVVRQRDAAAVNENMATGKIEVFASSLQIINEALTPPIYIDDNAEESEALRLKYRYLDIRKPKIQNALIFRHNVIKALREYIDAQGFVEVETPILTKSTPEGARDYLVPSRVRTGEFYALPQSPQIYKQLLMLAGMERYYQIARCFRDEDGRADRQPEFTQFDMEMSFVRAEDIQNVVEGAFANVFQKYMGIELSLPLPRMTWQDAMHQYGSDKPDTRFEMRISILNDLLKSCGFSVFENAIQNQGVVCAIKVDGGADISRKHVDKFQDFVKTYHVNGLAWLKLQEDGEIKSSLTKVLTEDVLQSIIEKLSMQRGDMVFLIADKEFTALTAMGQLRLHIAKERNLINPKQYNLLWITEFPLLEWDEENQRYVAMHHPFTSPLPEDQPLMESDPGKVRANAYDLVLNGIEMGSGSIRIHKSDLQAKMFQMLGMSKEESETKFGFLLEAFKYGTPPHGGFAFGIDRMVMVLLGAESLRDVIAFPKIQNGNCLMMETPSPVHPEQLDVLKLKIIE